MSDRRGRTLLAVALGAALVLVLFGGRLAGALEHWLLALHGR